MRFRIAALIPLLAACSEDGGGPAARPPEAEDRLLTADFEAVYRIGGMQAVGWEEFSDVQDVDFDADGQLYIRDWTITAFRIVVVDDGGALVAEFGRRGDGPGEFRLPSHMLVRPGGGVVVVDEGHNAYLMFGADGSFEGALGFPEDDFYATFNRRMRHAREGAAVFETGEGGSFSSGESMSFKTGDRTIYRTSLQGEEATTVPFAEGWEPRPERVATTEIPDPTDVFGFLADMFVYFSPNLVFDVLPSGGVAYSDSSAYEIKIETPDAPTRVASRPLFPQPVTEELRERIRSRTLEATESQIEADRDSDEPSGELGTLMDDLIASLRDMVENASFMPEVPIVRGLRTTWDGRSGWNAGVATPWRKPSSHSAAASSTGQARGKRSASRVGSTFCRREAST